MTVFRTLKAPRRRHQHFLSGWNSHDRRVAISTPVHKRRRLSQGLKLRTKKNIGSNSLAVLNSSSARACKRKYPSLKFLHYFLWVREQFLSQINKLVFWSMPHEANECFVPTTWRGQHIYSFIDNRTISFWHRLKYGVSTYTSHMQQSLGIGAAASSSGRYCHIGYTAWVRRL